MASKDRRGQVALKEKGFADLDNARRGAALNARQAYLGVTSGLAQVRAYEGGDDILAVGAGFQQARRRRWACASTSTC